MRKFILFLISICTLFSCQGTQNYEKYIEKTIFEGKNGSDLGELQWAILNDGLPYGPSSFVVTKSGFIVVDGLNKRLSKYRNDGKWINSYSLKDANEVFDIAIDKNGSIYLLYGKKISVYDTCYHWKRDIKFDNYHGVNMVELTSDNNIITDKREGNNIYTVISDTLGNIIWSERDIRYFIETKGAFFVREWHSGGSTKYSDSIYDIKGNPIICIKDLKYFKEIIGIDAKSNLYVLTENDSLYKIIKVNTKGNILAEIPIIGIQENAGTSRIIRVTDNGNIYLLTGWPDEKYQLIQYSSISK